MTTATAARSPLPRSAMLALAAAGALTLGGCATTPGGAARNPADPLEPVNRAVFSFNDTIDRHVAVPAAKAYLKVTPSPVRTAIKNFFSNIGDIGNFANNILQGNITAGAEDLMRVAMNSTFGLGGLIDFATPARLPKHDQDFGLTLGKWGLPSGPYVVLPLFGPSTVRDAAGRVVDIQFFDPTAYVPTVPRVVLFGVHVISARAQFLGATNLLAQAALDKYSFTRDAYLQRRAYLLGRGQSAAALPDYGDADDGAAPSNGTAPAATGK